MFFWRRLTLRGRSMKGAEANPVAIDGGAKMRLGNQRLTLVQVTADAASSHVSASLSRLLSFARF